MKRTILLCLATILAGCAAEEPTAAGSLELELVAHPGPYIDLQFVLPFARWQHATAGCEGLLARSALLSAVEGQHELGALIDDRGDVLCVDDLELLVYETELTTDPCAGDPSPQPNRELISERTWLSPRASDPTPTPVIQERRPHPTPSPVIFGVHPDPTPTPVRED